MKMYQMPHSGEIEVKNVKDYYSASLEKDGRKISLDINFSEKSTDSITLGKIKRFLENLFSINEQNKKYYVKDYENEGETLEYLQFYIEECGEELSELIDIKANNQSQEKQLLEKLELIRVGFYPDNKDSLVDFAVFDYSLKIDGEYGNHVLVVWTNEQGTFSSLTWES